MSIFKNFLIAQDEAIGTLIRMDGEYGTPDETLSARAWRKRANYPKFHAFLDALFFFDREQRDGRMVKHCELCFEAELTRKHLPSAYQI
ncbi:MAG: hypothetical protein LBJ59_08790 [Zoogloeaceae bacterium]|jgi:hypothetical protein|nr:hypothetical protein [Zoogloeaceae bacterium]